MTAVTIHSYFGTQENEIFTVSTFLPSICHEVMGPVAMIFVFAVLSFQPTFPLRSFTFIKRLFSSSSLSAIRVVSSTYLKLLIFLLAILIPVCDSSSLLFYLMYRRQGSRPSPWKRNAKKQTGCLGRPYK